MNFNDNSTTIILAIIVAIVGAGLIFKFVIKKKSTKNSGSVNIKDSDIGGDVAGRDIDKSIHHHYSKPPQICGGFAICIDRASSSGKGPLFEKYNDCFEIR